MADGETDWEMSFFDCFQEPNRLWPGATSIFGLQFLFNVALELLKAQKFRLARYRVSSSACSGSLIRVILFHGTWHIERCSSMGVQNRLTPARFDPAYGSRPHYGTPP